MKLLSLLALLLLTAIPAQAQLNPSPNDPQAPVTLPAFSGKATDFSRIEFLCASETDGDYISTAICTAAETETRSQARRRGIDVFNSNGGEDDKAFTIFVQITSAGRVPRGMSVRVEASRYYEKAIDQEAGYNEPAAFPRRGKLVFYDETITGVGQGDSLEEPLRRRARQLVQNFFHNYMKE